MTSIISAITGNMNGLKNFITEVLECQSKAQEVARVQKELSNIRTNFGSKKGLSGYSRKKYVAKLLYIYLLGYSFDFGFPEMIELLASNVFSEKQIGYITLGVYLNGNYDLVTMLIEHFRKEIRNVENEPAQCLAIAAAANIGGKDIAESLSGVILQALQNPQNSDHVKKTACLALCRLYRETPSVIQVEGTFTESLNQLLFSHNFGVQLSAATLILILLQRHPEAMGSVFQTALMQLSRVFFDAMIPADYIYGRNPIPWLTLKYLRILQFKPNWDETETDKICKVIDVCLQKTDTSLSLQMKEVNTNMMLLFEAVNIVIARRFNVDLLKKCATILGGFLTAKYANVRYVAIETLTRLVQTDPSIIPALDQHRQTLYLALRDQDNSIRRRTLSLLFAVCTKESAEEIVHELLNYLRFADVAMREPLCLKIAVMAEQFAEDPAWFVDVVLQLITLAGDQCNDGVWYRVVQVVSTHQSLQRYATMTSFQSMQVAAPHDRLICLASQLVGEYVQCVEINPDEIIQELINKFRIASDTAKGIIMSALAKIGAKYPPGRQTVGEFLMNLRSNTNLDIQQRAIEYTALLSSAPNVIASVFKPIPPFEKKVSSLHRLVMEGEEEEDEEEDQNDEEGDQLVTQMPARAAQPMPTISAQQAAAPKEAKPVDAISDLLGGGAAAPAPAAAAPAKPVDAIGDLLGTPSTGNAAADILSAAPQPMPMMDSKEAIYKRFLSSDSGVCFEDANAAINLNITMNGPNAIMSFNIQNKTAGVLTGVGVHIPPNPSVKIQSRPGANQINRNEMTVYQFAIMVSAPYIDPPTYTFRYKWNEQIHNEVLDLPLPIFKFVTPFNMDHATFFQRWGSMNAPNQTAQAEFAPTGDPVTQMKSILTTVFKAPVLALQVPPNNVCGAGVINTERGVLGILCRFYFENNLIHVQIKGTTPQITSAVQKVLDLFLK